MNKKLVGILVITLLITTALPAIGFTNLKELKKIDNSSIGKSIRQMNTIEKPFIGGNRGSLFMQLPVKPDEMWSAFTSDQDRSWRHFDDFWDLSGPICDVHWWGFSTIHDGNQWINCMDAENMIFDIAFYNDDGTGKPGDMACIYKDISPNVSPTGIIYDEDFCEGLELYYFEVDLDPCCQLSEGWISIFKTYNPSNCIFAWLVCPDANWNMWALNLTSMEWIWGNWDLSFILTDGIPDISDLECEGDLYWTDVDPGSTVTGNFKVRNNGDPDSILHWKIDQTTKPTWGSDWSFTPNASLLTTDMGWLTVDVEFKAPPNKNKKFTHKLKVVNSADSSDFCEIDIYLKTPRSKGAYNPLLLRFFEQFPYAFPILRQLLGLN
jgi:hypothetical protein